MPPPEKKVVPVVCAVLRRHDRVLVARRPMDKLLAGMWEFPGGKIEPGESPAAALHRELLEELACTVEIEVSLPPFHHEYDWCIVELHPFLASLAPGSPEPHPVEHLELRWLNEPELLSLATGMAPADLPLLADPQILFA